MKIKELQNLNISTFLWRDDKYGECILTVYRDKNGNLNSPNHPSKIFEDKNTKKRLREEWFLDDRLHRDTGPAVTYLEQDEYIGSVLVQEWYREGDQFCESGPSLKRTCLSNGVVVFEGCYKDGRLHSRSRPSVIMRYDDTGVTMEEEWYLYGNLHREGNLPAVTQRWKNGMIQTEAWYENGVSSHRKGKPCAINYDKNGKVKETEYANAEGVLIRTNIIDDNGTVRDIIKVRESSIGLNLT